MRHDLTPEEWQAFELFKREAEQAAIKRRAVEELEAEQRMADTSKALHARGVMKPLSRKHTKMSTINDWAADMGIVLTPSVATRLGHRCARMYRGMFGKEPRKRKSLRKQKFYLNRYLKSKRVKSAFMVQVGVYPRLLIERAWQMVMTETLRIAEEADKAGDLN